MKERLPSFASSLNLYEVPFLLTLFAAPLAIGTVHSTIIFIACASILLAFSLFILNGRRRQITFAAARLLVAVMVFGCVFLAFQIIPLPDAVLVRLSPLGAQISSALNTDLGIKSSRTISLDPSATALELLKALACLMIFKMAAMSDRSARMRILQVLAVSGFTVALIGFLQKAFGSGRILGFYSPEVMAGGHFISTLVNANHLAGFLGFTASISLGIGLEATDRSRRILFTFMAVCCGAGVFLTLSRGGIAAFAASQILMLFMLLRGRFRAFRNFALWQLFILLMLALASGLAYTELSARYETISTIEKIGANKKFEMFGDAAKMAVAYWPAGVGRGAFESAIDMFKGDGLRTWSHAENEYLQIACDMGIPFAVLLFSAFIAVFVGIFRRPIAIRTAGALAGIYMLALQNSVDFSLEITSILFAFFAAIGAASGGRLLNESSVSDRDVPGKGFDSIIAIAGTLTLACSIAVSGHFLQKDIDRVLLLAEKQQVEKNIPNIFSMIGRHRADYYLPLIAGAGIGKSDGSDRDIARKLLLHSSYLNPKSPEPHLFLARLLLASGQEVQAFSEYRQAIRLDNGLLDNVLGEMDRVYHGKDIVSRAVPEEPAMLGGLVKYLIKKGRYDEAVVRGEEAVSLYPDDFDVQEAIFGAYFAAKNRQGELRISERLVDRHPQRFESHLYRATALSNLGRKEEAFSELATANRLSPNNPRVLMSTADIYLKERMFNEARETVRGILMAPNASNELLAEARSYLGYISESEGRFVDSVNEYKRALILNQSNIGALWGMARSYERLGEWNRAIEALEGLKRRYPGDKRVNAELSRMKTAKKSEIDGERFKEILKERSPGSD